MTTETIGSKKLDGHRLTEFIYGTVTALVAVAGLMPGDEGSGVEAMAVIIVGAVAVWFAHAYASSMSRRVLTGRALNGSEVLADLRGSWPIISAGVIVSAPLVLTAIGTISLPLGLQAANGVGLVILALVGLLAGILTKYGPVKILILMATSTGLGLMVLAVETLAHH